MKCDKCNDKVDYEITKIDMVDSSKETIKLCARHLVMFCDFIATQMGLSTFENEMKGFFEDLQLLQSKKNE